MLFALLVSCTNPAPTTGRVEAPTREPDVSGRTELISHPDLLNALSVARARLLAFAPSSPIFRVVVISPTRVEAYYCPTYFDRYMVGVFYQNDPQIGFFLLQRVSDGWRILPGKEPRVFNDEHAIITG